MLLRLAYLTVTTTFALFRLLLMNDQDKDTEILVLRHQLTLLQRQLNSDKIRFTPADRALLAALLHRPPRHAPRRLRLLVHPDTVLRWHHNLLARRHAVASRPKRPGRPRTIHSIRALVLRPGRENPTWGYRRLHGELLVLGVTAAASTVWEILRDAGIDPPAARPARVRTVLQRPPAPSRHRQRSTTAPAAIAGARSDPDHRSQHPAISPFGRRPQ